MLFRNLKVVKNMILGSSFADEKLHLLYDIYTKWQLKNLQKNVDYIKNQLKH